MNRFACTNRCRRPRDTRGTTLTEVLMSMMILSIGVISLASLFPVGMLNSIRAGKLTRATMLLNSCEAMVDLLPHLIHDPDQDGNLVEHNNSVYIIDPWGRNRIGPSIGPLARYHAGFNNETRALDLVSSPDNWDDNDGVDRSELLSLQSNSVMIPPTSTLDLVTVLAGLNSNPPTVYRVFLLDPRGRESRVRTITGVNLAQRRISWSANRPVPTTAFTQLTELRIERQDVKYSWLLTVRKPYFSGGAAPASVDAVVFFRRPLSESNEVTYTASFGWGADNQPGVAGSDDDGDGNVDEVDGSETGWPGSDDLRTVRISWTGLQPNLRQGGWIFEPTRGQWYRIEQVLATTPSAINLQVDRDVTSRSTIAMVPAGIVSVFPLGTR